LRRYSPTVIVCAPTATAATAATATATTRAASNATVEVLAVGIGVGAVACPPPLTHGNAATAGVRKLAQLASAARASLPVVANARTTAAAMATPTAASKPATFTATTTAAAATPTTTAAAAAVRIQQRHEGALQRRRRVAHGVCPPVELDGGTGAVHAGAMAVHQRAYRHPHKRLHLGVRLKARGKGGSIAAGEQAERRRHLLKRHDIQHGAAFLQPVCHNRSVTAAAAATATGAATAADATSPTAQRQGGHGAL